MCKYTCVADCVFKNNNFSAFKVLYCLAIRYELHSYIYIHTYL